MYVLIMFKNFFKKETAAPTWFVVGLGNPGKKYENTRHNIGFDALDVLAKAWNADVRRSKFNALYGLANVNGQNVLLLKPQTFMNLSGESLQKAGAFYNVPPQRMIVLFDDISLAPGVLRIRTSGSAGGHNGLKSIIHQLDDTFLRIKIGVGEKPHPEYALADWVLSRFTQSERKAIEARFDDVQKAAELLMQEKATEAMSLYNGSGKS